MVVFLIGVAVGVAVVVAGPAALAAIKGLFGGPAA